MLSLAGRGEVSFPEYFSLNRLKSSLYFLFSACCTSLQKEKKKKQKNFSRHSQPFLLSQPNCAGTLQLFHPKTIPFSPLYLFSSTQGPPGAADSGGVGTWLLNGGPGCDRALCSSSDVVAPTQAENIKGRRNGIERTFKAPEWLIRFELALPDSRRHSRLPRTMSMGGFANISMDRLHNLSRWPVAVAEHPQRGKKKKCVSQWNSLGKWEFSGVFWGFFVVVGFSGLSLFPEVQHFLLPQEVRVLTLLIFLCSPESMNYVDLKRTFKIG